MDENLESLTAINIRNIEEDEVDFSNQRLTLLLKNCIIKKKLTINEIYHLEIKNSTIYEIELIGGDYISRIEINGVHTDSLTFEKCKELDELIIVNCKIATIQSDNDCLHKLETYKSFRNRGLPDSEDEKYFFIDDNLDTKSDKRGEASIYDTELFDFKIKD